MSEFEEWKKEALKRLDKTYQDAQPFIMTNYMENVCNILFSKEEDYNREYFEKNI